jgi:hypothetical protein
MIIKRENHDHKENMIIKRLITKRVYCNSEFETLLLYSEVRWHSKSAALSRLLDCRNEILLFKDGYEFTKKDIDNRIMDIFHDFSQENFHENLCYMVDISNILNSFNKILQGINYIDSNNIFVLI